MSRDVSPQMEHVNVATSMTIVPKLLMRLFRRLHADDTAAALCLGIGNLEVLLSADREILQIIPKAFPLREIPSELCTQLLRCLPVGILVGRFGE